VPDHTAIQLALRTQLRTLTVCTTGSKTLEATLSGYQRADGGSFLTDGFAVGMEVTPSGFAETDRGVIAAVTATVMTLRDSHSAEAPGAGRSLTVGLPELAAWDNTHLSPEAGRPYIEEEYIPATSSLLSSPSTGGTAEDTGLYVIRWYGLANTGLASITNAASAILELFKSGTALSIADGTVRVRGDIGPFRGPIRGDQPGWSVVTVTVPWRLYSTN
jgi:hypothetical protein